MVQSAKKKSGGNALDFCRVYLRKKPKAAFADIRDAAAKKGLMLYPISFGRAQALEGIVKSRPYGSKKKAAAAAKRGPGRPKGSKNNRGPGRPRKSAGPADLGDLVSMLRNLERDGAVRVIEKIRALVS